MKVSFAFWYILLCSFCTVCGSLSPKVGASPTTHWPLITRAASNPPQGGHSVILPRDVPLSTLILGPLTNYMVTSVGSLFVLYLVQYNELTRKGILFLTNELI